jgi:hypothetical protein
MGWGRGFGQSDRSDPLATPVRAATVRKRELRRIMERAQLDHLARLAEAAAREIPELASKLRRQLLVRPRETAARSRA